MTSSFSEDELCTLARLCDKIIQVQQAEKEAQKNSEIQA
jgi:hypothetical protein